MNKGARYFKCDFQVHTPRDLQFSGQSCVSDAERKAYSEKFIKACREKRIDAVAITDHHDLCFYNYIKAASLDEKDNEGNSLPEYKRIVVFPGMELTLDVPCQALLIFDADLVIDDETRIKINTALGIANYTNKTESKTGPTNRLSFKSINDVYDAINGVIELKGRFIVFPNIKDGGTSSILRNGFHNEYANGIFVGGYLDRGLYESHKSNVGWNNVIEGKVDAYGNRSIGFFQTSDNRTDTFEHLGISATWVKWSTPTAEGLRQACLAKKSRILQEDPKLPSTRIRQVKISGSSFLKDLEIEFNPQFNVCIGGRGTGKSSLLQYISWALGKDSNEEKKADLEYFIKNTLSSGSVEVSIIKTGTPHIIKRSIGSYEIKIGNDDWQPANSQNIVSIIRADSFAQKELSKHEKDKTAQLTRIIENAVNSGVESIKRQISENGNKIKEVAASYETYLSNVKSCEDLKTQIESLEEQIKSLNEQLADVPSGDQTIIKNNSLVANEKAILKSSETQIAGLTNQIANILTSGNFNSLQYEEGDIKNTTEVKKYASSHDEIIKSIKAALDEAKAKATSATLMADKKSLTDLHGLHDTEYIEAKGRQTKFEQIIKELEELRKRLAVLTEDRNRILATLESEKGTRKNLQKLYYQRHHLNISLYTLINSAVSEIASKSEGSLEIELTPLENIEHIVKDFLAQVTGSKGQPIRTQAFFDTLVKGVKTYKELLKFWFSIYKAQTENLKIENVISEYGLENSSLLETDFERINESLNTSSIIDFALELPTYDLKLLYCKDPTNKIPFEDASYGQQAGSILTILLNQEFGPLIIDQPEDDLDNKVIHQITENIVAAKHKRQLIFSSHNANIAVNGDAELILAFDHNSDKSAGEIIGSGSIDKEEIKLQVKDIMEGGIKAFEMRKTKYDF
jgi:chromosome segregation protein